MITDKKAAKVQNKAYQSALKNEKSQGAALRRIKTIANQHNVELSAFQMAILSDQNTYFPAIQSQYTKHQKRKAEQARREKSGEELLTNTRHKVFVADIYLKSFPTESDARKFADSLGMETTVKTVENPVSSSFSSLEMLKILQKIEIAFHAEYPKDKKVTPKKVERAIK